MIAIYLNVATAAFAFVAAGFWLTSSRVPFPKGGKINMFTPDPNTGLIPMDEWARSVSNRNMYAATFAGLSAISAGINAIREIFYP